jgi:hypothetical protein
MSRTVYKMGAIALLATVLLGVALLSSTPGYAASRTSSSSTVATQGAATITPSITKIIGKWHCGIISCSYYFTRNSTRVIAEDGLIASGYLAYIPYAVASAIRLIVAAVDAKAWEAYLKHQCLRVRLGLLVGLYSDGSRYCLN